MHEPREELRPLRAILVNTASKTAEHAPDFPLLARHPERVGAGALVALEHWVEDVRFGAHIPPQLTIEPTKKLITVVQAAFGSAQDYVTDLQDSGVISFDRLPQVH